MFFRDLIFFVSDKLLFYPFVFVFLASVLITIRSGFLQFRAIPLMVKMLFAKNKAIDADSGQTISSRTALFTAMSTSIGTGNIVGPVVAIGMGGPGALGGFIIAGLFGAVLTFCEVDLAIAFRIKNADGSYSGGPMYYIREVFNNTVAMFYAFASFALLTAWSANQANNLAIQLTNYGLSTMLTGLALAVMVVLVLTGGIKLLGAINDRLVPLMFIVFTVTTITIIVLNASQLPSALQQIFGSLFSVNAAGGALLGAGLQNAFRWGFAKGTMATEAGVGTATFPHSASRLNSPYKQGVLAMVSVFTTVFLSLLAGLTVLCSGAFATANPQVGVGMMSSIIENHFLYVGRFLFTSCIFLFAFGTILGNCYNASRCFAYLLGDKYLKAFYLIAAVAVFLGSISEVTLLWTVVDLFLLPVVIPNVLAILVMILKGKIRFARHNGHNEIH